MTAKTSIALSATLFAALTLAGAAARADAAADTVSPAQAKLIADYYKKKCALSDPQTCVPAGVDTAKGEVRVLDRDLTQRDEDIKSLESQSMDDIRQGRSGRNYALILSNCEVDTGPKFKADIALYKMFDKQVINMMNNAAESIWNVCQNKSRTADIKLVKKIKVIHFTFAPPSPALDNDQTYDFDSKTGTLTVKAFSDLGPPGRDSNGWKAFLRNN